ncbi:hypothetical protein OKW46_000052 [Paraburkholderia sp. WSM4179]|nr:hypothetical protein [Paraburkholderia sp. WSM4179]
MRNIKDLVLYKADRRRKYKHIDSLCRQAIDKMTPLTILRRLGSESTKTSSTSHSGSWGA